MKLGPEPESEPESEPKPVKKILGAGQKWTGSATLTVVNYRTVIIVVRDLRCNDSDPTSHGSDDYGIFYFYKFTLSVVLCRYLFYYFD